MFRSLRSFKTLTSPLKRSNNLTSIRIRHATGSVSSKPGSDSFKALNENAGHEVKAIVGDLVGAVAPSGNKNTIQSDLASIASLHQKIPNEALIYGGAGLIPYASTAVASVYLANEANAATIEGSTRFDLETSLALLHHVQIIQVQYGALILSFLGSIHWGLQWANYDGDKGHARYLIGIGPVLLSFVTLSLAPQFALMSQLAGFLGMWYTDSRLTALGWVPTWYASYRFWLTGVVSSSIILTLAGSAFYAPGDALTSTKTTLRAVSMPNQLGSEIQLSDGGDSFTQFTNLEKVKAEELKKEKVRFSSEAGIVADGRLYIGKGERSAQIIAVTAFPIHVTSIRIRHATGSVSSKPGSDSFKALNENAGHEVKAIVGDLVGAVAPSGNKNESSIQSDIASIASLHQKIRNEALIYGGAGLIRYASTAVASVYLANEANAATIDGAS